MKPGIPSGTRDFGPKEMARRNFILKTIREVYEKFGFEQIETPAMENLSTLEGKYGEEGDKLLFRILNSGPVFEKIKAGSDSLQRKDITEKGLRYDLTVPFARFVVMNRNELAFPFRRYQIQPVWRADRPQKGRYREFYQCDADVIGSDSLLNEIELVQIIDEVFTRLNLPVTIKMNHRRILAGVAQLSGFSEKLTEITTIIDKTEKIGVEGVKTELKSLGISEKGIETILSVCSVKGNAEEVLTSIKDHIQNEEGTAGVEQLRFILDHQPSQLKTSLIEIDPTLARGLNYYTGTIIEVKSNAGDLKVSICGGGRYDNLTGVFGLPGVSGVGISFGIDRIYDVMEETGLFQSTTAVGTKVLCAHFGEREREFGFAMVSRLRNQDIPAEIYPDLTKKITKQFDYANKKGIPYVVVVGEEEMKSGKLAFKNMQTGNQESLTVEEIIQRLKNS